MSLIKNSRIKIATIYILLAYLCISMVQANDTSNSNNHKNNINNEHHHSHHNHHHHHHHSQQQHNQHLRSRSHHSNSIRNNNNNKNSNLNTTNTNLDRRKILNITPITTTTTSPSAAVNKISASVFDNKLISNRSLKQNYSKISNNDNNHKLNLHKRNSIDNANRTVNGNSVNENLEIFTNYNGLRRKSLINTDYNNYHSISNYNNDNKNNVLHDVEMINEHHNNKWNYNNDDKDFDISTSAEPLPSVTMPTPTTTTTMSLVPSKGKTFHKMKDDGRHICVQHKTIQIPVKTREIYSRPTWKHVTEPCEENQICTRVQLVHEPVYRDIVRHKSTRQVTYECCPGWEPTTKNANSCMKPVCKVKCKNGGTCITPDTCSCPKGFTGKYCEEDINECITEKPCDQLCFNTNGSYYCECKKGFILMNDKQSCKKINGFNNDDDAFEARDLENDIDTDTSVLNTRIQKLEKMIANDRITTNELYKNFQTATHLIDSLKTRLTTLEKQQHDISHLQDKLMTNDVKTKTLEYLVNILLKCQKNPHNCQHI